MFVFRGDVYVTMQIMFLTRKSALIYRRGLRQRVASLTLNCNGDFAIRAYATGLVRKQHFQSTLLEGRRGLLELRRGLLEGTRRLFLGGRRGLLEAFP